MRGRCEFITMSHQGIGLLDHTYTQATHTHRPHRHTDHTYTHTTHTTSIDKFEYLSTSIDKVKHKSGSHIVNPFS